MKNLLKFFNLTFILLFIITTSCVALKDFRFIKNQIIIEMIRSRINRKELNSRKSLYVDCDSIIFMINDKNINEVTIAVPVLKNGKGIIGEEIAVLTTEGAEKIDDVLNCFTSNSHGCLEIQISRAPFLKFFQSYTSPARYVSAARLVDFLENSITVEANDLIYYMIPSDVSDENFNNIRIVYKTADTMVVNSVFQNNFTGRFCNIDISVRKVNYRSSLFGKFFRFFKKNRVTDSDRPYARLPEID
ncbi:MAG: hypothetical protein LBF68_00015 [Christensenellaceae bacterium]|jgi:hypothetical protein|nr:hypothetical protein [Christensenellaceae bacterium]